MQNETRNLRRAGALGKLMAQGQISALNENAEQTPRVSSEKKWKPTYVTKDGIKFSEDEFLVVDPEECEPWKYANRSEHELGDIQELMESIQKDTQLQPVLLRPHPSPHGKIKFEIIFGRRRHLACLRLQRPLVAIKKKQLNEKEAVAIQNAENKERKDVSSYSNALLYGRLISDGIFKTQIELASKLGISPASLNEVMAFNKIPEEIRSQIANIHDLTTVMALKIVNLINQSEDYYHKILALAYKIGDTITQPQQLERAMTSKLTDVDLLTMPLTHASNTGKKLFTSKFDKKGNLSIVINKTFVSSINRMELCKNIKGMIEQCILQEEVEEL